MHPGRNWTAHGPYVIDVWISTMYTLSIKYFISDNWWFWYVLCCWVKLKLMHCFQFTVSASTYIHTTVQQRWLYYHIIIYKIKHIMTLMKFIHNKILKWLNKNITNTPRYLMTNKSTCPRSTSFPSSTMNNF